MDSLKYFGLSHALKAKEAKDPNFFYVYKKEDQSVVMISGFLYWILELCSKGDTTLYFHYLIICFILDYL